MHIFSTSNLNGVLRAVSSGLRYPVIIVLILIMAATLVLLGSLLVEIFTERRQLKVSMPRLVDQLRSTGASGEKAMTEAITSSGLLWRQKAVLTELIRHPDLTAEMRQALADRLVEEEQSRLERIVKLSDLLAKLGPIFGLLGTLIPLGPGIIALGQGDTYTLSQSLLTAFDTTVAGLISAAVAMVISSVRKGWYANYMSILETLADCVLEVENDHAARE